jgi:hypothetical protein
MLKLTKPFRQDDEGNRSRYNTENISGTTNHDHNQDCYGF